MNDIATPSPSSTPPSASQRIPARARRALFALATTALLGVLVACGSVTPPSGGPQPPADPAPNPSEPGSPSAPFAGATTESCAAISGAEALYWDYMNGIIRVDYPLTMKLLPFTPAGWFFHQEVPLYNFVYPPGWRPEKLLDPSLRLAGANVWRQDDRAIWRRLNFTVQGAVTARDALETELSGLLAFLGTSPQDAIRPCDIASPDGSRASVLLRAGGATANVSVQVFQSPPFTIVFVQVAVAPTAEYADRAVDVFFPLTGQLTPDGSSGEPDCKDGRDNDNDGKADYPEDEGCTSADDESEAGP